MIIFHNFRSSPSLIFGFLYFHYISHTIYSCGNQDLLLQQHTHFINYGVIKLATTWISTSQPVRTEVRFASFLSGGFITANVVNPLERKLAKCTSVQCCVFRLFTKAMKYIALLLTKGVICVTLYVLTQFWDPLSADCILMAQ